MISYKVLEFGLSNFKSFKQPQYIKIKPLTIICGRNNCGKSSLIQSILLLSQSIKISTPIRFLRPLSYEEKINYDTTLLFEGDFCHLSDFFNIINKYSDSDNLQYIFNYRGTEFRINFFNPENINNLEAYVKSIDIYEKNGSFSISANLDEKNKILNYKFHCDNFNLDSLIERIFPFRHVLMRNKRLRKSLKEIRLENFKIDNAHVRFYGFFPQRILFSQNDFINSLKLSSKSYDSIKELIKTLLSKETLDRYVSPKKFLSLRFAWKEFDFLNLLEKIHYIGPLREDPRRYYPLFDVRKTEIGNRGQNAPQILKLRKEKLVPPFKIYSIKDKKFKLEERKNLALDEALLVWSNLLKLPEISPLALEDTLFKILISLPKDNYKVTIQDVGFGISQILPVFIESLRMNPGHTLILEQPEIHLHPNMQSNLADFLLCMALSGKNYIIETHSEHLILRFCLRIAQDLTNKLNDLINIVFIEPPRVDKKGKYIGSKINELILNKYGEIENWPIGFFDETDHNTILKAGLEKRIKDQREDF